MTTEQVCFHSAVFPAHRLPKRVNWYVCVVHVYATHISIPTFFQTLCQIKTLKAAVLPRYTHPHLWVSLLCIPDYCLYSELSILESRKLQPLLPSYCPELLWLLPLNIIVTVSCRWSDLSPWDCRSQPDHGRGSLGRLTSVFFLHQHITAFAVLFCFP